ncbi:hypothetical protein HA402_001589 [Bradysia odoriphaga]|nr:hypothetical protein HA402_001589 [Bradysia odoriphaga]
MEPGQYAGKVLTHNTSLKNTKRLWLGLKAAHAQLDLAKLMFFYGDSFENHQIYELDQATDILKHPRFDLTRETALYIHGYIERPEVESIHVIVDAYQRNGEQNIIILNWGELADGNYLLDAVQNAKQLGPRIASVLIDLFNNGLQRDLFHLVGHSLGGQLSGMVGRNVIKKSKGTIKLKRISALDPAFPPFYPAIGTTAISKNDADMVDVIHTDAGLYGAPRSTGTVDFWPNSGKTLQPGCPKRDYKLLTDIDLCSHRRSWRFWAESVAAKDTPTFHSVKSKSWSDFKKHRVDESYIIQMGLNCPENARPGDYYLQTNGDQPYSKGVSGITYEKNENVVFPTNDS